MQTFTTCMQCQAETGLPNFLSSEAVDIPDDGVISITCDQGHQTHILIQQTKFEILSEMGVRALASGSYRDSVSSFAGMLERLYEFFVLAVCRKNQVDSTAFSTGWKAMSSQSERQLGAFIATWLLETKGAPPLLIRKAIEIRNDVIHKGKLATRDEAMRYGQAAFDAAMPVLEFLRSEAYSTTIRELTFEGLRERSKAARDAGKTFSTMSMATPLGFTLAEQSYDLSAAVASHEARPSLKEMVEGSRAAAAYVQPNH